jgi:hypothetical protein
MDINIAVSPRKVRKTRNKSRYCIDLSTHPLGDDLPLGISVKIIVLFVDKMIFLG